jgi:uncharacterized OsmC-like protein
MIIRLLDEYAIRLELDRPGFSIESDGAPVSPYHLLAASLASCTAVALEGWAHASGLDTTALRIDVRWEITEERPARVTAMTMELAWPGLPEQRRAAAERVADTCGIHATLEHGTPIVRRLST